MIIDAVTWHLILRPRPTGGRVTLRLKPQHGTRKMIVLALLVSDRLASRVENAMPPPHRVVRAWSAAEAARALRRHPADVLMLDPLVGRPGLNLAETPDEILSLGVEFPYLPVVFYASNAAVALPIVARFPTREACGALVAGLDDDAQSMSTVVKAVVTSSLVARLTHHLVPLLKDAPPSLLRAIRHAFASPHVFRTVDDLTPEANMSRRTFDRWLQRCEIISGIELLHLAKAFSAVRHARDILSERQYPNAGNRRHQRHGLVPFVDSLAGLPFDRLDLVGDGALIEYFANRLRRVRGGVSDGHEPRRAVGD